MSRAGWARERRSASSCRWGKLATKRGWQTGIRRKATASRRFATLLHCLEKPRQCRADSQQRRRAGPPRNLTTSSCTQTAQQCKLTVLPCRSASQQRKLTEQQCKATSHRCTLAVRQRLPTLLRCTFTSKQCSAALLLCEGAGCQCLSSRGDCQLAEQQCSVTSQRCFATSQQGKLTLQRCLGTGSGRSDPSCLRRGAPTPGAAGRRVRSAHVFRIGQCYIGYGDMG